MMRACDEGGGIDVESMPQANAGAAKVEKMEDDERRKMVDALAIIPARNAASL